MGVDSFDSHSTLQPCYHAVIPSLFQHIQHIHNHDIEIVYYYLIPLNNRLYLTKYFVPSRICPIFRLKPSPQPDITHPCIVLASSFLRGFYGVLAGSLRLVPRNNAVTSPHHSRGNFELIGEHLDAAWGKLSQLPILQFPHRLLFGFLAEIHPRFTWFFCFRAGFWVENNEIWKKW